MRFAFVLAERATYPVAVLCHVLEVSRSGFYAWRGRAASARAQRDVALSVKVKASFARSLGTYGGRRIRADLAAEDVAVSTRRVGRLMRHEGLVPRQKRRAVRTTDSRHALPIAPNVLQRDFQQARPDAAWVTDVTYVALAGGGYAYLAVMLDLFSRRVVGWALSATNDTALALEAWGAAVRDRRPPRGLIHHSDRGSPYASVEYRAALAAGEAVVSMSRKGDCWDNAVAESFNGSVKAEFLDHLAAADLDATRARLVDYIDGFYNLRRRHSKLGYLSPVEFELRYAAHRKSA